MAKTYPIASRTTRSFEIIGAQSDVAIWTPASGFFAVLTELLVTLTEPAVVTVYRGDTDEPSKRILHGYFPAGVDRVFDEPIELGADEVLRITTSAGNCYGVCGGFELPYRG